MSDPTAEQISDNDADRLFEQEYNKALGRATVELPEEVPAEPEPVAPEPEVEEVPETEETKPAENKAATPDPNDWLNALPEEARNRYTKEMQDFRANAMRNSALQRHLDAARNELAELKKPKTPEAEPAKLDKWEALTETDKELALSVEERIAAAVAQAEQKMLRAFDERVAPIERGAHDAHVYSELDLLKQAVPNYEEVVQNPHFQGWLQNQTQTVQHTYLHSTDHRDAVNLMQLYASSLGYPPATQSTPQPQPNLAADKVAAARGNRVQASTPVTGAPTGIPRNPHNENLSEKEVDELFNAALKQARGY